MAFPRHVAPIRRAVLRLTLAAAVIAFGRPAAAYRDGFETPSPAWRLADSDCRAAVLSQERTFEPAAVHSGAGAEYLRLRFEQGSTAHLTLAIPPARVIEELSPALWVKATGPRVQLRGRVILPRSRDPRDGSMLAVWVDGDVYDRPGGWQRLAIRDLPLQVQRQARVKRGLPQSGEVDEREAYLDLIVLNAYTSPGVTDLWIDDLEVEGFTEAGRDDLAGGVVGDKVDPRRNRDPAGAEPLGAALAQPQPPHLEGTTLVGGQGPLAMRMIEHRGESFSWLKSLGFNAVRLPQPATSQELEESRRLDLWLAAPPPHFASSSGPQEITPLHDRVAAWDLGSELGEQELETARRLAYDVRRDDPRENRPVLASPREQFWGYRRFSDVLLLGTAPLGTRCDVSQFRQQIEQQASRASRSGPIWANVQTTAAGELLSQLQAIAGAPVAAPVEAAQIRLLALSALEAGATGFCFHSPSPLDAGDSASQHRAAVLHLLNEELSLVEPWIVGSSPREMLDVGIDEIRGTAWSAERSKLILLARHFADDQFTAAPSPPQPVSLLISGTPPSWKAYRIGADRLTPVWSSQVGGGMRINVPDVGRSAWIVVTDDPLTMNFLARRLRQSLAPRAKLRHEILSREMSLAEQVLAAAPVAEIGRDEGLRGLENARQSMRQCERLLDASDFAGSLAMGERVEDALAHVRRRLWWSAANAFASRVSSPCCASFAALPLHWNVTGRVRSSAWGANILPAGDFEDVAAMQAAGWKQDRNPNGRASTLVELSPEDPHQGRYALHVRASEGVSPSGFDGPEPPLLRIVTPALSLDAGNVVRISGWVRGGDAAAPAMLRVRDSLGGDSLADEVAVTNQWRPFVLYRAAPSSTHVTLALALSQPGDLWIDSVIMEVLQSPGAPSQVARQ